MFFTLVFGLACFGMLAFMLIALAGLAVSETLGFVLGVLIVVLIVWWAIRSEKRARARRPRVAPRATTRHPHHSSPHHPQVTRPDSLYFPGEEWMDDSFLDEDGIL